MKSSKILLTKYIVMHITLAWFLLFSFACNTTPTVPATFTPKPTETPVPTNTPNPTAISQPTATVTPMTTPVPLLISKAGHVIRSEHFDSLSALSFDMYGVGVSDVIDGHLVLTEKIAANGDPWSDGEAAGRSRFSPQTGNVSVFLFKAEINTYFGYHFELYENTDAGVLYRGINLDSDNSSVSLHIDKGLGNNHSPQKWIPVPKFKRDTWYYYSLQVQPDGFVTVQLWERDQPANVLFNQTIQLEPEWAKPGFTFVVTTYQGKMEIDEYQEVELADGALSIKLPATERTEKKTFIPGDARWVNTGIVVQAGQIVLFSATGVAYTDDTQNKFPWTPEGAGGVCQSNCLMPQAPYGALIGKISDGDSFMIGSSLEIIAPKDGVILLAMNDNRPYYFDNSGGFDVMITIYK